MVRPADNNDVSIDICEKCSINGDIAGSFKCEDKSESAEGENILLPQRAGMGRGCVETRRRGLSDASFPHGSFFAAFDHSFARIAAW